MATATKKARAARGAVRPADGAYEEAEQAARVARRDAAAGDDSDAERWLDEGGSFSSEAVTTLIAPAEEALASPHFDQGPRDHCECGHLLRAFGGGRHRVYFEPGESRLDDPVMNGVCPRCGRGLPGRTGRDESRGRTDYEFFYRRDQL